MRVHTHSKSAGSSIPFFRATNPRRGICSKSAKYFHDDTRSQTGIRTHLCVCNSNEVEATDERVSIETQRKSVPFDFLRLVDGTGGTSTGQARVLRYTISRLEQVCDTHIYVDVPVRGVCWAARSSLWEESCCRTSVFVEYQAQEQQSRKRQGYAHRRTFKAIYDITIFTAHACEDRLSFAKREILLFACPANSTNLSRTLVANSPFFG